MTKDTGVPKLKGATNLAIWLFRLEKHMTAKGTWDAVRFVPYRQSTRQTTPLPIIIIQSSTPKALSQESIRETTKTTPLSKQTGSDQEKRKPKFRAISDY